jgi:hypothetical protein
MSYKLGIDATLKASIYSEVRFYTNRGKSNPKEQGNEKQSGNPRANIYESPPGQEKDHTTPST